MAVGLPISNITGQGTYDAVPSTRTITINGTTYDLSTDRSWTTGGGGGGGVTSVALSAPTGFSVTGSPITSSGTLALVFAAGYSLPLNTKQSNWDDAYTWVSGFPTQTGNAGKFLSTNGSVLSWATALTYESDPIYTASSWYTTTNNSTNWNTAYGWGNHSSAGYLTSASAASTYVPLTRTITINGTTYDLSVDRSWTITATASPGGSSGQVQYNNAGSLGGASNVEVIGGNLAFVDSTFPSAPSAGRNVMFTDSMGGRQLMAQIGPDGFHYDLQPSIFSQTTIVWLPGTGTTLSINWASSYTARNSGTGAAQNSSITLASTNAVTSLVRAQFGTGTTATGASGIQTTLPVAWLGNATGLGGFFFFARFAMEATSGTYRMFIGLSANNATLAGEPSSLNNSCGIILDSTDTTFQYLTRGTTLTKTNTTQAVSNTIVFDFYMYAKPNATGINFELRNALTNAVLSTALNVATTLPASTTFMYMQAHVMSATGTTAKILSLNKMYLETNL